MAVHLFALLSRQMGKYSGCNKFAQSHVDEDRPLNIRAVGKAGEYCPRAAGSGVESAYRVPNIKESKRASHTRSEV